MNTSKPNPHTITPTTVMESEFDELTAHRKPGKSTGRPRSRHKHMYTPGWASYTFASHPSIIAPFAAASVVCQFPNLPVKNLKSLPLAPRCLLCRLSAPTL